jgi:formamidopyrimidine-DNA glycosylase
MPELPEVETIRRDLEKEVTGKRIKSVEVLGKRSIRRHRDAHAFVSRLEGHKVMGVDRKGKYLVLRLDPTGGARGGEPADVLVVHLGMSGQLLRPKSAKEPVGKHTHVVITFTQAGQLRFIDPRTFGEMFVTTPDHLLEAVPELAHLGFDPLSEVMSWTHFAELLYTRRTKLKALLMDQKFLAGIGNIYSDEILFEAGLRYERSSETLSTQEIRRLYRAMIETLQNAIKHRGSSLSDEQYRDIFGEVGGYQSEHKVYDRQGEPCPRCRHPIERIKWQNRSTFFCPQCQT